MHAVAASVPAATEHTQYVCTGCGACCRWPGLVHVAPVEVDRLAAHLALPVNAFIDRYTKLAPDRRGLVLIDREDGGCIFLGQDDRCQVYPARPEQCKDFPHGWTVPELDKLCPAIRLKFRRQAWLSGQPSPYPSAQP
jgi:uncharacterized protein